MEQLKRWSPSLLEPLILLAMDWLTDLMASLPFLTGRLRNATASMAQMVLFSPLTSRRTPLCMFMTRTCVVFFPSSKFINCFKNFFKFTWHAIYISNAKSLPKHVILGSFVRWRPMGVSMATVSLLQKMFGPKFPRTQKMIVSAQLAPHVLLMD